MTALGGPETAREAFRLQAWGEAFARFGAEDQQHPLPPDDLELFAQAAYLLGRYEECVRILERAYQQRVAREELPEAAETAFWLAFDLMNSGAEAQAGGWLARVQQHAEATAPGGLLEGLQLVPTGLRALMQGDPATGLELFTRAHAIGRQCRHPELIALSGIGIGQAKVGLGQIPEAVAKLDEVMVAVTAGEVSAIVAGVVYCAVISTCHETYHLRRAAEWTKALGSWCDAQPDLVPFRGQCLVHRAQIMQLNGAWEDAMEQAHRACLRMTDPPGESAVGMAHYEQGELHRLRGEYAAAEAAYRQASEFGSETQPGLALLRLAQGRLDAACAGMRRVLHEPGRIDRPRLCAAWVEIALAADDVGAAREACDELVATAGASDAPALQAMAAQATGAVLLAEGDARAALDQLRRAWALWHDLGAPHLAAQVRVLQGTACRELGDLDAAQMEYDAAARVFRRLQAKPDLTNLERLGGLVGATATDDLTAREVEVLRAVASGKTNRGVAEDLFLSEKTVARHLSNIFTKLGLTSRAAATAYAYEHDLL